MEEERVYPFGQLSLKEQKELEASGGPYEYFVLLRIKDAVWVPAVDQGMRPSAYPHLAWRLKKVYPSIDWSQVHPDYNYLAKMANGQYRLFKECPLICDTGLDWKIPYDCRLADIFVSFKPGNLPWKKSVAKRFEA